MLLPETEDNLVLDMAGSGNVKHAILKNTITQQLPVRCNRSVYPDSECGAQAKRKKRRVVVA